MDSKKNNSVVIYSKPQCPYCTMAKQLAESRGDTVEYKMLGQDYKVEELMTEFPNCRTFPQIIFNGEKIGGYTELKHRYEI
tara:strand:- start:339 stop:581 length:243 start_codon:yes stop_codon:yes gene_type:complete